MSTRLATAQVPGLDCAVTLRLHEHNDRYISEEIANHGSWEPFETELVLRLSGRGDLIVDAGANIGWYSVVAALNGATVLAVEPAAANLELLRINLEVNGVTDAVTVVDAALGSASGGGTLHLSDDNQGDHRLSVVATGSTLPIVVTTMDAICDGRVPRLVKVDTQGSEVTILRGAQQTLAPEAAAQTVMVLEFWPFGLLDCGASAEELVGLMSSFVPESHRCYEIKEEQRTLLPVSMSQLARLALSGDLSAKAGGHTNLLVVPHADVDTIADLVDHRSSSRSTFDGERVLDLSDYEASTFSQSGEDGIIAALAALVDCPQSLVEFGAGDGSECNGKLPRERGWSVVGYDGAPGSSDWVRQAFVTAENASDLLVESGLASDLGVLSIDLDGNDYWVLRRLLESARPAIIVAEYNATLGPVEPLAVPYRRHRRWDHSNHFGTSLAALALLAADRGYGLVGCGSNGVNAFFVRNDLLARAGVAPLAVASAYRPPMYGAVDRLGSNRGHRPTSRRFERVGTEAEAEAAYRAASGKRLSRPARVLVHRMRTSDLVRYRATRATNLVNRWRGIPTR